jgi:hypothetical protein
MSHAIKLHPLREYPQRKTIPTTASTSYTSVGKCYSTIESQTFTGSLKTIRSHYPKTPVSLPSGCSSSWWSSTFQLLQESNGPVILCVEVSPLIRPVRHRCVDCSNHSVGLMEVSRFSAPLHRRLGTSVLRNSLLLRPPTYELQSSSGSTRSTRSSHCCELVVRPK